MPKKKKTPPISRAKKVLATIIKRTQTNEKRFAYIDPKEPHTLTLTRSGRRTISSYAIPTLRFCSVCENFDLSDTPFRPNKWWKKTYKSPLENPLFGRFITSTNSRDQGYASKVSPYSGIILPPPETPKYTHPLSDEKEGEVKERREIAVFHILVQNEKEEFQNLFRFAVDKFNHKTPVKYVRGILSDAEICDDENDLLPPTAKEFECKLTPEDLNTALFAGAQHRNQGRVMGQRKSVPARDALERIYNVPISFYGIDPEWNHLVAHRFLASESQQAHNLVIATDHCNTQMEALESAIQVIIQTDAIPVSLHVRANTKPGTHIATAIQYTIFFPNGNQTTIQFDPAVTEKPPLALKNYFYDLLKEVFRNPRNADSIRIKTQIAAGTLAAAGLFRASGKRISQPDFSREVESHPPSHFR